jgi:hypothetical protein
LNLPLVTTNKHIPDQITVTAEELKSQVFEPVINPILEKITEVIGNKHPKKVFLYGDFGNLEYLKHKVSNKFSQTEIIQENNTAASRGAIHYGLHVPLFKERVPPRSNVKEKKTGVDSTYYDFDYRFYTHVVGIGKEINFLILFDNFFNLVKLDFGTSNTKWYYAAQDNKNNVDFE